MRVSASPQIAIMGKVVAKLRDFPFQENHSDCSEVAQYALVWGSSIHVKLDPDVPVQSAQSDKPKSPCTAPREIKEQGFSEAER